MCERGLTPRSKRSKIEKETNFNVIMNFVILMILCVVTAVLREFSAILMDPLLTLKMGTIVLCPGLAQIPTKRDPGPRRISMLIL
jgi:hypothetical protein